MVDSPSPLRDCNTDFNLLGILNMMIGYLPLNKNFTAMVDWLRQIITKAEWYTNQERKFTKKLARALENSLASIKEQLKSLIYVYRKGNRLQI
jgi:hypothetical protein